MSESASSVEGEDFSPSSDEWNPNPSDNDSEDEVFERTKKISKSRLRSSIISPKKTNIQIEAKPKMDDGGSDSDSSVEDYLVHPDSINFKSNFFQTDVEEIPSFDQIEQSILCGVDMKHLSTSGSESDHEAINSSEAQKDFIQEDQKKLNFKQIHDFAKNLETIKTSMQSYDSKEVGTESNLDIGQLLALGEQGEIVNETNVIDSESDEFEEVKVSQKNEKKIPKEGITITINLPKSHKSCSSRENYQMKIRRRMNLIKKQNQVFIHKVHVLCWIAHGNYVNRILNYPKLMKAVLQLVPSNNCYPPKQSDLKYLEMILKWYIGKMKFSGISKKKEKKLEYISSNKKCNLDDNLTLVQSLSAQIKAATACSRRSLILIFVVLMRALGLQCRMVLSFVVLPLKPAPGELYSLANKTDTKSSKESTSKDPKNAVSYKCKNSQVKSNVNKSEDLVSSSQDPKSLKNTKIGKKNEHRNAAKIAFKTINKSEKKIKVKHDIQNKTKSKQEKNKSFKNPSMLSSPSTSKLNSGENLKDPKSKRISTKSKKISPKKDLAIFSPAATRSKAKKHVDVLKKSKDLKISQLDGADDQSPSPKKLNLKNIKSIAIEKQKLSPKNHEFAKKSPNKNNNKTVKLKSTDSNNINSTKTNNKKEASKTDGSKTKRKLTSEIESESEYFHPVNKQLKKFRQIDRRVLSTDDDDDDNAKNKRVCDIWVEIFLEAEEKWISVDVANCKVHCVKELYNRATHPITYIVAWNNDLSLKDVTRRYVPNWNTVTRKLRAEQSWWDSTLNPWLGQKGIRDHQEDEDLYRSQLEQPLPTSIQEFKNHPLYVLKRHILKFQAIYPPDAMTLGFIRGEPVYARECVHTLHSREIWLKEAKVVRLGEKPYKIVKARPKYDKLTGTKLSDMPLELFGSWQIEDYVPPTAENGIVPRNAYGNVELFKPSMLPKGTVHLQLPGLNKVARKLQVDCAPAVVGFDFHSGFSHPTFDGFVVCEEYQDALVAAWYQEEEEAEKRAIEKIEKRVYGNWRRLIKGLIIREKLKARYNFGDSPEEKYENEKDKRIKVKTAAGSAKRKKGQ